MEILQLRVLYRQFLLRIVDLEILTPQGDIARLLGQFAALLIIVSLWILLPSVGLAAAPSSPDLGLALAWVEEHFLISTTMLVVGLFAVLSWESMFPDRRDVLVLAPLPVRARTLFFAKVAAVATALSLTILALNVFPGIAAPFAFAAAPTLPPPTYDPAMAPVSAADLQTVLDRDLIPAKTGIGALAPGRYGGIAVGVLEHGVRRVFSYGTAEPDSIFEIGSITKTFTGLILAKMAEEGSVKFDEPVRELLPPGTVAKPSGGEITLLDLATQHSGLPRMPANFNPADMRNPYVDYRPANLYAYIGKHGVAKPAVTDFLYSNLGFGLLGQALVNRAGMPYPKLLEEMITGPLGMSDTVVSLSTEQQKRFIQGYNSQNQPVRPWTFDAIAGAGAIRSTAGDLLTYLDAQLHPEKFGALSAALTTSHELRAEEIPGSRIGLAWFYRPQTGGYGHDGGTGGYTSYANFNPKRDYAVVVLFNSGPGLTIFSDQLGEHIRQRLAGEPAVSLANPVASGSRQLLRSFAAYWTTMLATGTFIFCFMLSVQGLAQLLPRQWFLRFSTVLQMTFFCLLLSEYFLQPVFSSLESLAGNRELLYWLPSYWFFGLFQKMNGPIPPELEVLARRAWMGLGLAVCGAAAAYLICYLRTLRKIAEQPDILTTHAGLHWLPHFGDALQTAVVQFSIRTLLRSRQHRVILSFYVGLAVGLAIFFAKSPAFQTELSGTDPWHQVNAPMLMASFIMMGAAVMGARVLFSLPLNLRANWIFRVTPVRGGADCMVASRRSLYVLAVIPIWTVAAIAFLWLWPWRPALSHLAALGLVGTILAELCLHEFSKIPFTCSYLPGRSYTHMVVLSLLGLLFLMVKGVDLERQALQSPTGIAAMLALLCVLAAWARHRTGARAKSPEGTLQFEQASMLAILPLGLNRDGVWRV